MLLNLKPWTYQVSCLRINEILFYILQSVVILEYIFCFKKVD